MTYRLLFDENLSPELVELAIAAGYVNSTAHLRSLNSSLDATVVPTNHQILIQNSAP